MWVPEISGVPEHIALCVETILTTPMGTVALDRDFGIDPEILDLPIPAARSRYVAEVLEKVRRYEPRVKVEEILFTADNQNGTLKPKVVLSLA